MVYMYILIMNEANSNLLFQYYIKRNETQSHEYHMIFIHHSVVTQSKNLVTKLTNKHLTNT